MQLIANLQEETNRGTIGETRCRLIFIQGDVQCNILSVNLKRVTRRNAMVEVGSKSWNRGCIPIIVFARDKARISISHSARCSDWTSFLEY